MWYVWLVRKRQIGGNDDLQKAHKSGELAKLIQ
jgi:hypothetical protein